MFWDSIIWGISLLGFWQVWVAVLLYMFALILFMILTILIPERYTRTRSFLFLFLPFLNAFLLGLVISYLFPILLGQVYAAPINEVFSSDSLEFVIENSVIAAIAVSILIFIPIIGVILEKSVGLQTFLMGLLIFTLYSQNAIVALLADSNIEANVYPNFWEVIAFIIFGYILIWLTALLVGSIKLGIQNKAIEGIVMMCIGYTLNIFIGLLPLFMYTSYIQLSIYKLL